MQGVPNSKFRGDLNDLKKIKIFFSLNLFFSGSVDVCSKIVGLVATSMIFFAASNFHYSCECKCFLF